MTEPEDVLASNKNALDRVRNPLFPCAAKWDPAWQFENMMGTNPLWLTEALMQHVPLTAGMRVLDLGCGKGASSMFLAKEFGLQVWTVDLWMSPDDTWQHAKSLDFDHLVYPIHTLPFAAGFFDAVVCVDAWHLFGLGEGFVSRIANYVRDGGYTYAIDDIPLLQGDAGRNLGIVTMVAQVSADPI